MLWPIRKPANGIHYVSARITRVTSDEAGGELTVRVVSDGGEEHEIVYGEMYYSQLDGRSEGQVILLVTEAMPQELKKPRYEMAAAQLYEECGADDGFLQDMYRRGNRLYVHHTEEGREYIVLAKHMNIRPLKK